MFGWCPLLQSAKRQQSPSPEAWQYHGEGHISLLSRHVAGWDKSWGDARSALENSRRGPHGAAQDMSEFHREDGQGLASRDDTCATRDDRDARDNRAELAGMTDMSGCPCWLHRCSLDDWQRSLPGWQWQNVSPQFLTALSR